MTLNRDDELLSYFPKKGKRELNAEDILDIDGERLMQRDNTWDTLGKYESEKDNAGSPFHGRAKRLPNLNTNWRAKRKKRIRPNLTLR